MSRAAIQDQFLRAEAETRGAQLLFIRSSDGTEYLWQGDLAYWSDRAPNLFPYVARLTDGKYYLDGRLWHMPGTDAPYMCIEPWCSLPPAQGEVAVLEEQEDLISLPSRKIYRNTWRIRIRA